MITLSVVIPTFNRCSSLSSTLKDLELQSFPPTTVIIVNDGSTDDTASYLRHMLHASRLNLLIINQTNKGRSCAKNSGAHASQEDVILFCDDDMRLPKDWIYHHVCAQYKHDVVTGDLELGSDTSLNLALIEYINYHGANWKKAALSRSCTYITATNFSIKRKLFQELGGFDPSLPDSEDYHLALRIRNKGHLIYYSIEAVNVHIISWNFSGYARRTAEYFNSRIRSGLIHRHHPFVIALKKVLGRFLLLIFDFEKMDDNKYNFIPRGLRFFLFRLLIDNYYLICKSA